MEKIKRGELMEIAQGLSGAMNLTGGKLGYAVAKNKRTIMAEMNDHRKVLDPSEKFEEFDNKRIEVCKKFADKDKDGKPILENNEYKGLKDNEEFQKELDKIKEGNEEEIEKHKEKEKTYNKMLDEEIEIELHKVKSSDLPENITVRQIDGLFMMIEQDDKKEE